MLGDRAVVEPEVMILFSYPCALSFIKTFNLLQNVVLVFGLPLALLRVCS